MKTITQLMLEEHGRINRILLEFEKELDSLEFDNIRKIFDEFKWNLEKHFFVEEKSIFDIFENIEGEEVTEIFDLMQEHGELTELVKNIGAGLDNNIKPNISGLKEKLMNHARFEDQIFYPRLDEELEPYKKQEIISRINEIIRR
jgi:iron-sulfur cluster repair protein YtfE (RIC family)